MKPVKKKVNYIAVSFLALFISNSAYAATDVVGGTVQFNGSVVDAACAVTAGSANQAVQLDQVRSARFTKAGDAVKNKKFAIELKDCDSLVSKSVQVYFKGDATGGQDKTLLAVTGNKSVALRIIDSGNRALVLNDITTQDGLSVPRPIVGTGGNLTIQFDTEIVALSNVVSAGDFSASADFNLLYP